MWYYYTFIKMAKIKKTDACIYKAMKGTTMLFTKRVVGITILSSLGVSISK